MMAPAIGGVTLGLAVALLWSFRSEPPSVAPESAALPAPAAQPANGADRRAADRPAPADTPPSAEEAVAEAAATPEPDPALAPLPGQAPATPMAQLLEGRQESAPPELVEGERQFAAESVDAGWAPGAEAGILSSVAQITGLELIDLQVECKSTMCRVQMVQPRTPEPDAQPLRLLGTLGLEPRWVMAMTDPSGGLKSVAYLWREGTAPPPPGPPPPQPPNDANSDRPE
jgi:hypothetical protein